jgi:hypothetical protein
MEGKLFPPRHPLQPSGIVTMATLFVVQTSVCRNGSSMLKHELRTSRDKLKMRPGQPANPPHNATPVDGCSIY